MESAAAVTLWERSLAKKLKYVTFVGDGDSAAYTAECKMNSGDGPYGVDYPVIKEEYLNHISKRLGTRLRALKIKLSEVVQTKTGKEMMKSKLGGIGKLTVTDKLAGYYASNAALEALEKGMQLRETAKQFGVPKSTLLNIKKGHTHNPGSIGRRTALFPNEELVIAQNMATLANFGYALDIDELRLFVQTYVNKTGRAVPHFHDAKLGKDWASGFLKRHADLMSNRMCQNKKKKQRGKAPSSSSEVPLVSSSPSEEDEDNVDDPPIYKAGKRSPVFMSSEDDASPVSDGSASIPEVSTVLAK
ncbi:hypothetical protein Pcinc_018223 [Petrolisthes cinctipes]|uniref:HTH psq-type domain-containing protein n=1 Tax=Petrolisthes cinctipes TaxID=88211 RepID=A0AAE1KLV9_PETCI|nr:hypothetical protein Pcinc_018223 [Petrolisthes cinctipes]